MRKVKIIFIIFLFMRLSVLEAQESKVEILWDTYGVPHVFGSDMNEMYYGFGWAQMHNHANLILKLYGQARGRAAEYWGPKYISSDRLIHLFEIPEISEEQYAEQNPIFKRCLDAFVNGINDYSRKHPEAISNENRQVLPISATDIISHTIRVLYLVFLAGSDINAIENTMNMGSNAYAISPSRSSSKYSMLVANPHLPWTDCFTFFEAELKAKEFKAYGASLVGIPVLTVAFNDYLGWTHTVNPIIASNRYELSTNENGYLLDGAIEPFKSKLIYLKVLKQDGSIERQAITLNYSRHGPIIGQKGNKAYAIRIAGLRNPNVLYQWHLMAKAKNWKQFEASLKMMQLPMFNVIYADSKGNISYLFDGNVPQRANGDWEFWHGTIDGSNSKYIWDHYLSYEQLPSLFNPKSGFLQNANDPPWNCTYPGELDSKKYLPFIAPNGMQLRPQRAVNMIKNEYKITFDKLVGYKLNTEMEAADRFLYDLLKAVDEYPDTMAIKAATVLKNWDKLTESDSRGAVLFACWFDKLNNNMFKRPWDPSYPVETPSGLVDPKEAVRLLIKSSEQIIKDYDSLNVAWGDVYRFRIGNFDLPANGGDGNYGIFRAFNYRRDKDKKYRAVSGDSYVAVVEFARKVKAKVLLSYGNSSQPGNKHIGDQLVLLSEKRLRLALLDKKEIKKNLEEKELLIFRTPL